MRNQLGIQRRGLQRAISLGVFTCLVASTNLAVFVRVAEAQCPGGVCPWKPPRIVQPAVQPIKAGGAEPIVDEEALRYEEYLLNESGLSKEAARQEFKNNFGREPVSDGFKPTQSSDDSCSDGSCSGNGGGGGGGGGLGGLLSKIGPMMMQMLPLLMMMLMMKNNQNKNNTPLPPTDFGALATATPIPTITLVPTIAPTASLPPTDFGPLPTNTPSAVVSTTPAVAPGLTPAVVITGTPTITSVVQASSVISAF